MTINNQSFVLLVQKMLPRYISADVRGYIACQFALESAFGRSVFAVSMHNYCGMKVPVVRFTYAHNFNESGKFAKYQSLGVCIADYCLYLQALKFNKFDLNSVVAFRSKLDSVGYCRDLGYLEKIDNIYCYYFDPNFKSNYK